MKKLINILIMCLIAVNVTAQKSNLLKLWYNQPAGDTWEAALPLGNGRLGAMVYGNVVNENIQLNEATLWTGSPSRNDNPDALAALPEIRRLVLKEDKKKQRHWQAKPCKANRTTGRCISLLVMYVWSLKIRMGTRTITGT